MKRAFPVLWRLAVLSLPWQTRWFWDASLAGWPWEQGRVSLYVSWILIFLTILSRVIPDSTSEAREIRDPVQNGSWIKSRMTRFWIGLFILFALSLFATRFEILAVQAVLMWWLQIGILAAFVVALFKSNVSRDELATWFCVALIPHAVLGLIQFAGQEVFASTLLGISAQHPETLGVSIVVSEGVRILRAYGGFPHPNIFGGWLAAGALVALWKASKSFHTYLQYRWALLSSFFAGVLVLTFSRSAMLALGIGLVLFAVHALRQKQIRIPLVVVAVGILFTSASQFNLLQSRVSASDRLEVKSLAVRSESAETFTELFRSHPWIGTGPNAELFTLAQDRGIEVAEAPLEPPHNVFLLLFVNLGVVGVGILFVSSSGLTRGSSFTSWIPRSSRGMTHVLFPLLPLFIFDHYLWTLWAGQALFALTILFAFGNMLNTAED